MNIVVEYCPTASGESRIKWGEKEFVLATPDEMAALKRDARVARLIQGWMERAEIPPTDKPDYVKGFGQAHEDIRYVIERALATEEGPITIRRQVIQWAELKPIPKEGEGNA